MTSRLSDLLKEFWCSCGDACSKVYIEEVESMEARIFMLEQDNKFLMDQLNIKSQERLRS